MKQKFKKLSFVRVGDPVPDHFEGNFDAIIEGSYLQLYGGRKENCKEYSIFKIDKGEIVDELAWYDEESFTLLPDQDRDKAEQMIEDYRLK